MNSRNIRCIDNNPYEQLRNLYSRHLPVSPENDNRVQRWVHQLSIHQLTPQRKLTPSARPPSTNSACDKGNIAPKAEATNSSTPDAFHAFTFDPQASESLHSAKDHHHNLYQSRPSRKRKKCPSYDPEPREIRRSTRIQRKGPIAAMAPRRKAPRGKGKGAAAHPASKNTESKAEHETHDKAQVKEAVGIRDGQLPSGRVTRASQGAGRVTTGKYGLQARSEQDLPSDKIFNSQFAPRKQGRRHK